VRPGDPLQDLINALKLEITNFEPARAQIPDYSTSFPE